MDRGEEKNIMISLLFQKGNIYAWKPGFEPEFVALRAADMIILVSLPT